MSRLNAKSPLPDGIRSPRFRPEDHGIGIVHLGIGAFHRAHQSVYTEDAIEAHGGDWRTLGVSLRSRDVADQLNPQDGRYTLIVRENDAVHGRVLANIAHVCFAPEEPERLLSHLAAPTTRIVSLTVTEKGYGLDRQNGGLDIEHPGIKADLEGNAAFPQSAMGWIVRALGRRHRQGAGGLTVLSCDNFSGNGAVAQSLVMELARILEPDSVGWIADNVRFPSTMVDRITPASSAETLAEAQRLTGFEDMAAVEAEPFTQWVIEDDFAAGRPHWEAAGAILVEDVKPFEMAKLRMLNGTHSMLAYTGHLLGLTHVRDVMADADLPALVARHIRAAALTLPSGIELDLQQYGTQLLNRFANKAIAHQTYQIAMDGTQKLPQRIFEPALYALEHGLAFEPYAWATAAWMRYALGQTENGSRYDLRDPRQDEIARAIAGSNNPEAIFAGLSNLPGFMPEQLSANDLWHAAVLHRLHEILNMGVRRALQREIADTTSTP